MKLMMQPSVALLTQEMQNIFAPFQPWFFHDKAVSNWIHPVLQPILYCFILFLISLELPILLTSSSTFKI